MFSRVFFECSFLWNPTRLKALLRAPGSAGVCAMVPTMDGMRTGQAMIQRMFQYSACWKSLTLWIQTERMAWTIPWILVISASEPPWLSSLRGCLCRPSRPSRPTEQTPLTVSVVDGRWVIGWQVRVSSLATLAALFLLIFAPIKIIKAAMWWISKKISGENLIKEVMGLWDAILPYVDAAPGRLSQFWSRSNASVHWMGSVHRRRRSIHNATTEMFLEVRIVPHCIAHSHHSPASPHRKPVTNIDKSSWIKIGQGMPLSSDPNFRICGSGCAVFPLKPGSKSAAVGGWSWWLPALVDTRNVDV